MLRLNFATAELTAAIEICRALPDTDHAVRRRGNPLRRAREHVSQVVFARHLKVTKGLISQWEHGEKRPAGPSLKLLTLVEKHGLSSIT